MTDRSKQPIEAEPRIVRRPYASPSLVARERLAKITAGLKSSAVGTDGSPSDRRLKRDIRLVGRTFDGLNVYTFRYRNDPVVRMGVIAQEVLRVHPGAVTTVDGYLAVDYGQIGRAPAGDMPRDGVLAALPPLGTGRSYRRPTLVRRERLARIAAEDSKSSGISSDLRLKENIRLVGRTFEGLNVYTFRYRADPVTQMGVIAQELLQAKPAAVRERDGYLVVDYAQIG